MPFVFNPFTGTFDFTATGGGPDPLTQYTKLAGRAGTANDTLLSTGGTGTLYGSSTVGGGLILQANNNPGTGGQITLLPNLIDETGQVQIFNADLYLNSGSATPHQLFFFSNGAAFSAR